MALVRRIEGAAEDADAAQPARGLAPDARLVADGRG
jgi:hypothetical protein